MLTDRALIKGLVAVENGTDDFHSAYDAMYLHNLVDPQNSVSYEELSAAGVWIRLERLVAPYKGKGKLLEQHLKELEAREPF